MTREDLYNVKVYSNTMHFTGVVPITAHNSGEAVSRAINALLELGFSGFTVQGAERAEGTKPNLNANQSV